jgi:hypothetical protein
MTHSSRSEEGAGGGVSVSGSESVGVEDSRKASGQSDGSKTSTTGSAIGPNWNGEKERNQERNRKDS